MKLLIFRNKVKKIKRSHGISNSQQETNEPQESIPCNSLQSYTYMYTYTLPHKILKKTEKPISFLALFMSKFLYRTNYLMTKDNPSKGKIFFQKQPNREKKHQIKFIKQLPWRLTFIEVEEEDGALLFLV